MALESVCCYEKDSTDCLDGLSNTNQDHTFVIFTPSDGGNIILQGISLNGHVFMDQSKIRLRLNGGSEYIEIRG